MQHLKGILCHFPGGRGSESGREIYDKKIIYIYMLKKKNQRKRKKDRLGERHFTKKKKKEEEEEDGRGRCKVVQRCKDREQSGSGDTGRCRREAVGRGGM